MSQDISWWNSDITCPTCESYGIIDWNDKKNGSICSKTVAEAHGHPRMSAAASKLRSMFDEIYNFQLILTHPIHEQEHHDLQIAQVIVFVSTSQHMITHCHGPKNGVGKAPLIMLGNTMPFASTGCIHRAEVYAAVPPLLWSNGLSPLDEITNG